MANGFTCADVPGWRSRRRPGRLARYAWLTGAGPCDAVGALWAHGTGSRAASGARDRDGRSRALPGAAGDAGMIVKPCSVLVGGWPVVAVRNPFPARD